MKTIQEQVGGRPLSAVTPEKRLDALGRPTMIGMEQLQDGEASSDPAMKSIIEVRVAQQATR